MVSLCQRLLSGLQCNTGEKCYKKKKYHTHTKTIKTYISLSFPLTYGSLRGGGGAWFVLRIMRKQSGVFFYCGFRNCTQARETSLIPLFFLLVCFLIMCFPVSSGSYSIVIHYLYIKKHTRKPNSTNECTGLSSVLRLVRGTFCLFYMLGRKMKTKRRKCKCIT